MKLVDLFEVATTSSETKYLGKFGGVKVYASRHAFDRDDDRNEEGEIDYPTLFTNAATKLITKQVPRCECVVFSQSADRGIVFDWIPQERQLFIITILPKGIKKPVQRDGRVSPLVLIESTDDTLVFLAEEYVVIGENDQYFVRNGPWTSDLRYATVFKSRDRANEVAKKTKGRLESYWGAASLRGDKGSVTPKKNPVNHTRPYTSI